MMSKWLAMTAATVVAVAAVAGTASARPQAGGTVVDVAASNKNFSTLVTLVKAAGLAGALSGSNAQLTVFAPTNAAFKNLEAAVPGVTTALTDPMNKGLLVQVLKYHVLGSKVTAADALAAAKKNAKVPTLLGKNANGRIALSLKGGKVVLSDSAGLNTAIVTKTDLAASNGVVHVINKVIVPKSVATALKKAGLIN
jgi:uncharacterized surface protein with fasciclin (FAS1) repeats